MEDIRIVLAGPNDADLVGIMAYELLCELFGDSLAVSDEEVLETSRQLIREDSRFSALIAFNGDNKPVGVMTLADSVALFAKGRFGVITEFFVDPGKRSHGVGEKMIDQAKQLGRKRGWSCIELNAPGGEGGQRAVNFYLREGFRDMGPTMKLDL